MLRLIREAEIAWLKALKGMSPTSQARPVSPWKSRPPSANSSSGRGPARLADHRRHPVAAELVPVAVEEDVVELLDRLRREELGVGAPEDRLRAPRAELEQARQPALGVRDDEVVLGRVGAVVVVEAGVHAAELGQAHRHVAVVEDHRHAEALAQVGRDAAEVRHRDGEDDDRVDVLLALEHLASDAVSSAASPSARSPRESPCRRPSRRATPRRGAGTCRPSAARARHGRLRSSRPRPTSGSRPSATRATRPAGRGTASRSGRCRPRTCPSRAATTRACSRSGSRGRPPRRRRGSSALSRPTA